MKSVTNSLFLREKFREILKGIRTRELIVLAFQIKQIFKSETAVHTVVGSLFKGCSNSLEIIIAGVVIVPDDPKFR